MTSPKKKYNQFRQRYEQKAHWWGPGASVYPGSPTLSDLGLPTSARQVFIEDKERGHALFEKIARATKAELALYLTDPDAETRWLAGWRRDQLLRKELEKDVEQKGLPSDN